MQSLTKGCFLLTYCLSHIIAWEFEFLFICATMLYDVFEVYLQKKNIRKTKLSLWEMKTISTDKAGQFNISSSLDQGLRQNPLDGISDNRICIILANVA